MLEHLRGICWLLGLTLVICSGLYPVTMWAIGQSLFRQQAQGSLIADDKGKVIGSRLIAQPFTGDEYFQPRPSAASYNAMASGGSNYAASNYQLRDRVAKQLGPIVRYGKGAEKFGKRPSEGVQDDLEAWFQQDRYDKKPGIVAQWLEAHGALAEAWIKTTGDAVKGQWKVGNKEKPTNEAFVLQWQVDLPELYADCRETLTVMDGTPSHADLSKAFFGSFSKRYPGEWATVEDYETKDKQKRKRLAHVKQGSDLQGTFFDMWRQEHPDVPLEQVPGDMVTASGSGLDPHITLDNARYQLNYRIAGAQVDKLANAAAEPILKAKGENITDAERKEILTETRKRLGSDLEQRIHTEIDKLLEKHQEAPFHGLIGVPLVNVLPLNIELQSTMERFAKTIQ